MMIPVADAPLPSASHDHLVPVIIQIAQKRTGREILNHRPRRNADHDIFGALALFTVTGAMPAVCAEKMPVILEIQKGKQVTVGADNNIRPFSSSPSVRDPLPLVFVAVKALTASTPAAGTDIYFSAVDKHLFLRTECDGFNF